MSKSYNSLNQDAKSAWLDEKFDLNTGSELKETCLICTTPRVGSHFLAAIMASNEFLGKPFEYFQKSHINIWKKELGKKNIEECFDYFINKRTTKKGLFSVKAHWIDFEWMLSENPEIIERLNIKYYIFLYRKDILEQAISLEIASQCGSYISFTERNNKELKFDRDKIKSKINSINRYNLEWKNYFEKINVEPLLISYEDLKKMPKAIIKDIFKSLNMDKDTKYIDELLNKYFTSNDHNPKKQASYLNLDWKEKYISKSKFDRIKSFLKLVKKYFVKLLN